MRNYHINIFYSQEDGGYIADIPDLSHCSAFGENPERALAEVLKAKAAWMEAVKAEGKPIPPSSFKPVIYQLSEARS
jgi:predicted RNase H-like HicB family nuclease